MGNPSCQILTVDDGRIEAAVDLLSRFFAEEGFSGSRSTIAANARRMIADPFHWIALAPNRPHSMYNMVVTVTIPTGVSFAHESPRSEHHWRRAAYPAAVRGVPRVRTIECWPRTLDW